MFGVENFPLSVKILITVVLVIANIVYLVNYFNPPKDDKGRRLDEKHEWSHVGTLVLILLLVWIIIISPILNVNRNRSLRAQGYERVRVQRADRLRQSTLDREAAINARGALKSRGRPRSGTPPTPPRQRRTEWI